MKFLVDRFISLLCLIYSILTFWYYTKTLINSSDPVYQNTFKLLIPWKCRSFPGSKVPPQNPNSGWIMSFPQLSRQREESVQTITQTFRTLWFPALCMTQFGCQRFCSLFKHFVCLFVCLSCCLYCVKPIAEKTLNGEHLWFISWYLRLNLNHKMKNIIFSQEGVYYWHIQSVNLTQLYKVVMFKKSLSLCNLRWSAAFDYNL